MALHFHPPGQPLERTAICGTAHGGPCTGMGRWRYSHRLRTFTLGCIEDGVCRGCIRSLRALRDRLDAVLDAAACVGNPGASETVSDKQGGSCDGSGPLSDTGVGLDA